jgi:hypothetical protein
MRSDSNVLQHFSLRHLQQIHAIPKARWGECVGKTSLPVSVLDMGGLKQRNRWPVFQENRLRRKFHGSQPIEIERVPPVRDRIRGGEARGFPSDTAENTRFVSVCAQPQENKGLMA